MMIKSWNERCEEFYVDRLVTNKMIYDRMQEEIDDLRSSLQEISKIITATNSDLRLMAGEMTAQELRTVRAVLNSIKSKVSG